MKKITLGFIVALLMVTLAAIPVLASDNMRPSTFEDLAEMAGIHDPDVLEKVYSVFALSDDEITQLYQPFDDAFNAVKAQFNIPIPVRPPSLSVEYSTDWDRFAMAKEIALSTPEASQASLISLIEKVVTYAVAMCTLDSAFEGVELYGADGDLIIRADVGLLDSINIALYESEEGALAPFITAGEMSLDDAINVVVSIAGNNTFFDANGNPLGTAQFGATKNNVPDALESTCGEIEIAPFSAWRSTQRRTHIGTFHFLGMTFSLNVSATTTRAIDNSITRYVHFHYGGLSSPNVQTRLESSWATFMSDRRVAHVAYVYDVWFRGATPDVPGVWLSADAALVTFHAAEDIWI